MLKYSNYKKQVWETSTLSSRVTSWILNVDIIINNGTFEFKKKFFESTILQCNHLKKNIGFEKDPLKKLEILTALVMSGLVFEECYENYKIAIKELEKLVKSYFDNDGFPQTRSINDLIFFTRYLLLINENIKDAQQYIPEFLEEIVTKNLFCIKFFKTPNNQPPLFNGAIESNLEDFDKYLEHFKIDRKSKKDIIGGIYYAKSKQQVLYFDIGGPPGKNFQKITNQGRFRLNTF